MYLFSQKEPQKTYAIDAKIWQGDNGSLLNISFEAKFDLDKIVQRPANMWRYREALPILDPASVVSFGEGFTPLEPFSFGNREAFVKLDYLFPSGSYKDRGATMLMSHAKALGIEKVVQDSSGNAGSAVACYAAKAGIECRVCVPAQNSPAKLQQIEMYGASLEKVKGSREDAAKRASEIAQHTYYASHVYNPFFTQGIKTFAYEICEQMAWQAPQTLVLPAGNGSLILGTYQGFEDLQKSGIISSMPKFIAIQAKNCAPIYKAFQQGLDFLPNIEKHPTLAEGIAIQNPVRGLEVLDIIKKTSGQVLIVEEAEISETYTSMAKQGCYIEKTSSAIIAGLKQYLTSFAEKDEIVVSVFTGHGLKSAG